MYCGHREDRGGIARCCFRTHPLFGMILRVPMALNGFLWQFFAAVAVAVAESDGPS